MTDSRYVSGGLEERFVVTRADGSDIPDSRRYFVLDISGSDPHAVMAAYRYAYSVQQENNELGSALLKALDNPDLAPRQHVCGGHVVHDTVAPPVEVEDVVDLYVDEES